MSARLAGWVLVCLTLCAASAWPARAGQSEDPQLRIEATAHAASIRRAALLPGGKRLVTAGDDKTARVWSLDNPSAPQQILRPPSLPGIEGRLYGLAAHPTQPLLALAGLSRDNAVIHLFSTDTGRQTQRIETGGRDIRRLSWTPDGRLLLAAYSGDPAFRAFDGSGKQVFEYRLTAPSYDLEISQDGQRVAISSIDARVHVFRIAAGSGGLPKFDREHTLATFPGDAPAGLAFSPDGSRLAVGFLDGPSGRTVQRSMAAARVQLFEVSSGRRLWQIEASGIERGNLRAVRFSNDGQTIYAAGTGYRGDVETLLLQIDASTGKTLGEVAIARDSVTDLVALPDGRIAYTSASGAWGIASGTTRTHESQAGFALFRGAQNLRSSPDGRQIGWLAAGARHARIFDLRQRVVQQVASLHETGLPTTDPGSFSSRLKDWEDNIAPKLDGIPVPLEPQDVARAASALEGSTDLVVGTSRTLRRLGPRAVGGWKVDTQTEVRAVRQADNGRLIVTAMLDGTIRWWRARDGALLLSLFVSPDGRWVVWTEAGFFDASGGGESLVGWHVNRGNAESADFYPISRFRGSFMRPDVIDRVLDEHDVSRAVALANEARRLAAGRDEDSGSAETSVPLAVSGADPAQGTATGTIGASATVAIAGVADAGAALRQTIPPTLYPTGRLDLPPGSARVELQFALRSEPLNRATQVFVRVDGRPHDGASITLPVEHDGRQTGIVRMTLPARARTVQLFAAAPLSVSEPLEFHRDPAALPAAAKPTLYVLAIGVSRYARADYNLNFPAKDARDLVDIVSRQKGQLYRDVVVRTLLDAEARKTGILHGMKWLQEQVKAEDVGILFIAGHGLNDANGRYFFIPHDGRGEQLRSTGISEAEFRATLSRVKGKAYFFVDTCHAGNVVGGETGESNRFSRDVARIINDLSAPEHGVVVLASSSGRQLSQESTRWGNGAFTKAVVEGLAGAADTPRNGEVTFIKLDRFVGDEVRRLTRGAQTPVALTPRGGQFELPLALIQ